MTAPASLFSRAPLVRATNSARQSCCSSQGAARNGGGVVPSPRRHLSRARRVMRAASLVGQLPPASVGGSFPLSGCAPFGSPHRLRAGSARLAKWAGRNPSADAFTLSGNPARPPMLRHGATAELPAGGFDVGYPRTAAPLNGANQTDGAADPFPAHTWRCCAGAVPGGAAAGREGAPFSPALAP
jgi:hypothetical protein